MVEFNLSLRHRFANMDLDVALKGGAGVTALFGPSGCGKTSVVRAFSGLLTADTGRLTLGDTVLFDTEKGIKTPPHRRRMGYVFQDGRLFPHLSVRDNLRFPSSFHKVPTGQEDDLIDLLGLAPLLSRRPATLSGGETQRVALARALLCAPEMLLMDEPLAALDGPRKDDILPYLDRLKAHAGLPILYVTHAVDELARLADQVVLMKDGKITLQGSVFDVLSNPAAMPFLGVREAGALLEATVAAHEADGLTRLHTSGGALYLPGVTANPGDALRLRIRAQDVILAKTRPEGLSARNILSCTIEDLEQGRGPGVAVVLRFGDQRLLARITDRARIEMKLERGQAIFAILKATAVSRGSISG
ncbi:MAG: molybdenum ABC transporter ATP-binding protein [Aliishimia sp.]